MSLLSSGKIFPIYQFRFGILLSLTEINRTYPIDFKYRVNRDENYSDFYLNHAHLQNSCF